MSHVKGRRALFLTFNKCGSQWVRDVLAAPQILAESGGFVAGPRGLGPGLGDLTDLPDGAFTGPIYNQSHRAWEEFARPGDKTLIVVRDPRDVIVSWLHSLLYSHGPSKSTSRFREHLLMLDDLERMLFVVALYAFPLHTHMCSWARAELSSSELVVTYELLVAKPEQVFGQIVEFLEWPVSRSTLRAVVKSYSFEERSGRERGDEDVYSHLRKGVPGDWRNHFDQVSGEVFAAIAQRSLIELGYESSSDWIQELPRHEPEGPVGEDLERSERFHELHAEITRLREENRMLQAACKDRLELIERLSAKSESSEEKT